MALEFTTLNWVAVIAAAVAGFVSAYIWYMPMLFGKRWGGSVGREPVTLSNLTPTVMVGAVVMPLVAAYVLTLLIGGVGANSLVDGAVVGFLAWLGFSAMAGLNAFVYDGRNSTWLMITAGYSLVMLVVMGAIIGYLGA